MASMLRGGSQYPPFVRSLPAKKKKQPWELDEDDKDDIYRAFGSRGEGAYIVDERSYYTDSNGNIY